jgi:hypothetical protein
VEAAVQEVSRIIDGKGVKSSRGGPLDQRIGELMKGIDRAIEHYSARQ